MELTALAGPMVGITQRRSARPLVTACLYALPSPHPPHTLAALPALKLQRKQQRQQRTVVALAAASSGGGGLQHPGAAASAAAAAAGQEQRHAFLRVVLPTALALLLCNMDRICLRLAGPVNRAGGGCRRRGPPGRLPARGPTSAGPTPGTLPWPCLQCGHAAHRGGAWLGRGRAGAGAERFPLGLRCLHAARRPPGRQVWG